MSALQIFALNAARQARSHLEQLAGILVQDNTAPAAMRQQVAASLTEVHDVIQRLEDALEAPTPPVVVQVMVPDHAVSADVAERIKAALPTLPRRVPGATLDRLTRRASW